MTQQEAMDVLKAEGYENVCFVEQAANTDMGEHTHDEHTVHIILRGELSLMEHGQVDTVHAGDRIEFPAGTTHHAKCGDEGLVMVVGWKK